MSLAAAAPDRDDLLAAFKALAHESRLKLLGLVASGPRTVQDLAEAVGLTEPTTSHHLAMLREAGLVTVEPKGTQHWYAFDAEGLRRRVKAILSKETLAGLADDGADVADKVVRNYLTRDGRLKTFPSSRGKRWHVLVWFARMFEEGRRYAEREVNELISVRHHDFETWRRELVGYRMLAREGGVYWRLPEADWEGRPA